MTIPVILAGGSGTRLWPMSQAHNPKPFARLTGPRSLFQETLERAAAIPGAGAPLVVCGENHREMICRQAEEAGVALRSVVAEPVGCNTAPAVTAAALSVDSDEVLLVMPADHVIADGQVFRQAIQTAVACAQQGSMAIFGVPPTSAKTGFGYVEKGDGLDEPAGAFRIKSFQEKPDEATARQFLETGRHFWNAGMFVFQAEIFLQEMTRFRPDIVKAVRVSLASAAPHKNGVLLNPETFRDCAAESVDRAVMEHTDLGVMVVLEAGWNDIGSWPALWEMAPKDPQGNVVDGNVFLEGVTSSYVRAGGRPVAVVGCDRIIVVDTEDGLLVADMGSAEQVSQIVDRLE